jgi:hypothetical protein
MKNILILHGSFGNPEKNWYRYLGLKAEAKGYKVNIPQLEHIDKLNVDKTFEFLLKSGFIDSDTTIIGHSSGAAYILGILQRLPKNLAIRKAILVAGFVDDNLTRKLFKSVPKIHYAKLFPKKWDWNKIKSSCREFIIVYSDNDPYVQMRHAKTLHRRLSGKLVLFPGAFHFSVNNGGERFKSFPEIVKFI